MHRNKKGFALVELLIAIAIIAVITAIAVPLFTGSMKRAQKAEDDENFRSAAEIALAAFKSGEIQLEGSDGEIISESLKDWSGDSTMYYYTASGNFAVVNNDSVAGYSRGDADPVVARYTAGPGDAGYLISGDTGHLLKDSHKEGAMLVFYLKENSGEGADGESISYDDYYELFTADKSMVVVWMDLS